jgi:hypothetical protein
MNVHNKSTGEEIARELLTPGYVERALHRATRRKSRWNLVLLGAAILSIGVVSVLIVQMRICTFSLEARLHFSPQILRSGPEFWLYAALCSCLCRWAWFSRISWFGSFLRPGVR